MATVDRQGHWDTVYGTKGESEVSWFQASPAVSLDLIAATGVKPGASIVDVGGGAARLADALVDRGYKVTVLDLSDKALMAAQARLGARSSQVRWVVADVTQWQPSQAFDVWHDRAALHFLIDPKDRAAYAERVARAVQPGGHVIIGTIAPTARSAAAACRFAPRCGVPRRILGPRRSTDRKPARRPLHSDGRDAAVSVQPISTNELRRSGAVDVADRERNLSDLVQTERHGQTSPA